MDAKQSFFDSFLLKGLTQAEKEIALAAAEPMEIALSAGERLVTAGERFSSLGIVTEGELTVTRAGNRRPVIHKRLHPTDVFGVSSLFGGGECFPTTITAERASTVFLLDEHSIERMLAAVPYTARNYIALLTEKIRFLNRRLDTLAGRSAEERVAAFLLSGTSEGEGLGLTKSALASSLGLGRASLYRILDAMEASGHIRSHRDRIEILDRDALEQYIHTRKE